MKKIKAVMVSVERFLPAEREDHRLQVLSGSGNDLKFPPELPR
jgi:hypothetical protein